MQYPGQSNCSIGRYHDFSLTAQHGTWWMSPRSLKVTRFQAPYWESFTGDPVLVLSPPHGVHNYSFLESRPPTPRDRVGRQTRVRRTGGFESSAEGTVIGFRRLEVMWAWQKTNRARNRGGAHFFFFTLSMPSPTLSLIFGRSGVLLAGCRYFWSYCNTPTPRFCFCIPASQRIIPCWRTNKRENNADYKVLSSQ